MPNDESALYARTSAALVKSSASTTLLVSDDRSVGKGPDSLVSAGALSTLIVERAKQSRWLAQYVRAPEIFSNPIAYRRAFGETSKNVHLRIAEINQPCVLKGGRNILLTRWAFLGLPELEADVPYHPMADLRHTLSMFDEVWVTSKGEAELLREQTRTPVFEIPFSGLVADLPIASNIESPAKNSTNLAELLLAVADVPAWPLIYFGSDSELAAGEMGRQRAALPTILFNSSARTAPSKTFSLCTLDRLTAVNILAPLCDAFSDFCLERPEQYLLVQIPGAVDDVPRLAAQLLYDSCDHNRLPISALRCPNILLLPGMLAWQEMTSLLKLSKYVLRPPIPMFDAHIAAMAAMNDCLPVALGRPGFDEEFARVEADVSPAPPQAGMPGWRGVCRWTTVSPRTISDIFTQLADLSQDSIRDALLRARGAALSAPPTFEWIAARTGLAPGLPVDTDPDASDIHGGTFEVAK